MPRWFTPVGGALDVDSAARTGPGRRDVALAVVLGILAVVDIAFSEAEAPLLRLVASAVAVGAVPWRRLMPLAAVLAGFAVFFAINLGYWIAGGDPGVDATGGALLAGIIVVYALCRWDTPKRVGIGLAGVAAAVVGSSVVDTAGSGGVDNVLGSAVGDTLVWAVVAGFALAMRYRAAVRHARQREVRLAERNDLARELHDSVAHHLSAIAVQTQAARYVAADNPQAAVDALPLIDASARAAIDEMRQMVGILRSDGAMSRSVTSTSLQDFTDTTTTPTVNIAGDTDLSSLPSSVAAAAYRITQEAITNARRHANNATFIDVDAAIGTDAVELSIVNDGTTPARRSSGGFGLIGMQERAEALGGTLTAGPHPSTGWSVTARLPLVQP